MPMFWLREMFLPLSDFRSKAILLCRGILLCYMQEAVSSMIRTVVSLPVVLLVVSGHTTPVLVSMVPRKESVVPDLVFSDPETFSPVLIWNPRRHRTVF